MTPPRFVPISHYFYYPYTNQLSIRCRHATSSSVPRPLDLCVSLYPFIMFLRFSFNSTKFAFHHTIANNDLYVLKRDCVSCSRINQVLTFDEPWIAVDVACFSLHADSTFTSMIYDCDVLPHVFLFHCKCIMIQTMSGLRRLDWCFVCFASRLHV